MPMLLCVYLKNYVFPSPFPLLYTKVRHSLSPMLLPILTVSKLQAECCVVCAFKLTCQIQKTQSYITLYL